METGGFLHCSPLIAILRHCSRDWLSKKRFLDEFSGGASQPQLRNNQALTTGSIGNKRGKNVLFSRWHSFDGQWRLLRVSGKRINSLLSDNLDWCHCQTDPVPLFCAVLLKRFFSPQNLDEWSLQSVNWIIQFGFLFWTRCFLDWLVGFEITRQKWNCYWESVCQWKLDEGFGSNLNWECLASDEIIFRFINQL